MTSYDVRILSHVLKRQPSRIFLFSAKALKGIKINHKVIKIKEICNFLFKKKGKLKILKNLPFKM